MPMKFKVVREPVEMGSSYFAHGTTERLDLIFRDQNCSQNKLRLLGSTLTN